MSPMKAGRSGRGSAGAPARCRARGRWSRRPRRPWPRSRGVEPGHRRGEVGHHDLADVRAVGVAEEDQGQRLVGARRRASTAAPSVSVSVVVGTTVNGGSSTVAGEPSLGLDAVAAAAGERQRRSDERRAAASRAYARRTPSARSSVSAVSAASAGGAVVGVRRAARRTNAEPTITPSAYDATSAAWSPLLTPSPTPTGRSVACAGRGRRAARPGRWWWRGRR